MMENLNRQVKILTLIVIVLGLLVLACIAAMVELVTHNGRFDEITAERINIVQDGQLQMVISNHARQHPGMVNGKQLTDRNRPAGMIFFNEAGDECGGLVYDGSKQEASMTYSIDQFQNDQIMQLQYYQARQDHDLVKSYGLKLWERNDHFTLSRLMAYTDSLKKLNDTTAYNRGVHELKTSGLLGHERFFAGRSEDGDFGLFLKDSKGVPRIKIFINKQDEPVIQTLDSRGQVIAAK